ncbi:uncharacterized protein LOC142334041 [Lycorma delicatula]|uniref:uncharacterized protein LOC142334041 n=1 Tax=Lycorma delicatula TaxID=130591 RepID=UPI003F5104D1
MVLIEKKRNTKKCEEHRMISVILHATKVLLRVLIKRIYNTSDDSIEEEQYGFRRDVGTTDAIGLLRVIGQRHMERRWRVYVEFVDLQEAFDRVRWNKLLLDLEKKGVDWKKRCIIKELYYK